MLFRGGPSGGAETRRAHWARLTKFLFESARPMRSRIFPAPGAACFSIAVPERTRSTQGIDLCLQSSERNGQMIHPFRMGGRTAGYRQMTRFDR
jgi:hypothetical protein